MNLDAVIDSALAPIADKVSGFIFSYITKIAFVFSVMASAILS